MIDFNRIKYERIGYDKTRLTIDDLINKLKDASDYSEYLLVVKKINDIHSHIEEMFDYADIRNMRDLSDEFYKGEIEYWNAYKPKFDLLFLPFYEEMNSSRFKDLLLENIPSNFFRIIEYQMKITTDKNIDLQKRENELKIQYRNLNKTKVLYDGEERTIGSISGLFSSKDRIVRKKAHDTVNDFYYEHRNEYTSILFELVSLRNQMARNLGFNSYVEYSLYSLKRFGYDYKDISSFRDNIVKFIVPLCMKMNELKKEELGLEKLEYFDTIFFEEMPELKMFGREMLSELKKCYASIDEDLASLFDSMLENNYIDFESREDKVNFSITNYLTESCLPVVTGNYKKTYFDLQTTSHEMGHAFQKYCASLNDKEYIVSPLLKYPTMEIAEMFSYAMELIVMGYVKNLFEDEDYKKYCFMKIYNLLFNLPYICLVDEFQEMLYSKEDLKLEDIGNIWLYLVNKYHLEKSNLGHINLESGGYFYRQSHIYLDSFYYIDYALSYFGAFAIWNGCENDISLFKEIGGVASYYSFKDLIDKYNMPSPFSEDTVMSISFKLESELNSRRLAKHNRDK